MGAKKVGTVEDRLRVLQGRLDAQQRVLELHGARITALEKAVQAGQTPMRVSTRLSDFAAPVEATAPGPDHEEARLKDAVVVEAIAWHGCDHHGACLHLDNIMDAADALVAHRKKGGG